MFDRTASYTIVLENDEYVFLVDNDHGISVTNDAEGVCRKLLSGLSTKRKKRIIYKDTMQRWDEIAHTGFSFSHFQSLRNDDPAWVLIREIEANHVFRNF